MSVLYAECWEFESKLMLFDLDFPYMGPLLSRSVVSRSPQTDEQDDSDVDDDDEVDDLVKVATWGSPLFALLSCSSPCGSWRLLELSINLSSVLNSSIDESNTESIPWCPPQSSYQHYTQLYEIDKLTKHIHNDKIST